jgi:hypothetical protein
MGFAGARSADCHDIVRAVDKLTTMQLPNQGLVHRDCQDFRVWAGIMGKKESHYVSTQGAGDPG